jgi:alkylation response protein AidB-like acyl-CoA dehydrogenase
VDLRDTPEEARFRAELRDWLAENAPEGLEGLQGPATLRDFGNVDAGRAWSRRLAEAGYAALAWPKEYGGAGAGLGHHAIFLEELAEAEAPQHLNVVGLGMAGPTIIAHGTEDQKARYLPRILTADEIWCQGFSEPGAGSDLADVRTRAEVRDGTLVVNGQKVWSSLAQIADYCILLTRSDPASERQAGLTFLIVDMRSEGVEVRPLREMTGDAVFNEIFFTDVCVPVENVVGEIGGGWAVAMTTLRYERGTLGIALAASLELFFRKVVAFARGRGATDPRLRDAIARAWVELQALKLTNYRALAGLVATGVPGPEGSASKLVWSEQNQRLAKLALELHGADAPVADDEWRYQQIRSRANTIEAGTSEILRSIIAERVLGLPRTR